VTQTHARYDDTYANGGERFAEWRALGALAKADHVLELCERIELRPARLLEVGCGDGALLAELVRRGAAEEYAGFDVAEPAIERLRSRGLPGLAEAGVFDGRELPLGDGSFDVGVLSHVLEHADDPATLLAETARVARAVVVEVPLERNLSARRNGAAGVREAIGHVHTLDREAVRALARQAGLEPSAELTDPLTREVQLFFAGGAADRAKAVAKAGVRRALFTLSPHAAERAFTLHYACVCLPATRRRESG
jgi:SAM-dependent methyltransferase